MGRGLTRSEGKQKKNIQLPTPKTRNAPNELRELRGPTWNLEGEKRAYEKKFCLWKHPGTSPKYFLFKDTHINFS